MLEKGLLSLPADWATAWHEYAVEYDGKTKVAFAFDGEVYKVVSDAAYFDVPYYIILNTAIGDLQYPNSSTTFPAYHRIDSVHVAQPESFQI